jgi:asparaginyl-tRNA synthetase
MAADLASMDLSSLKAQLATVAAAVDAKEKALASDASAAAIAIRCPYGKLYERVAVSAIHASDGQGASLIGATVVVGGWVKTGRVADKGALAFLELNDGSGPTNLQCVDRRAEVHGHVRRRRGRTPRAARGRDRADRRAARDQGAPRRGVRRGQVPDREEEDLARVPPR